jgi:hypothetical protein
VQWFSLARSWRYSLLLGGYLTNLKDHFPIGTHSTSENSKSHQIHPEQRRQSETSAWRRAEPRRDGDGDEEEEGDEME